MTETAYKEKNLLNFQSTTGELSDDDKRYNSYWEGIYQYLYDYELGGEQTIKETPLMYSIAPQDLDKVKIFLQYFCLEAYEIEIKEKNKKAIRLLEQWLEEPDEYGEEFWKSFQEELQQNRFKITD